jgi:hypothetical protein
MYTCYKCQQNQLKFESGTWVRDCLQSWRQEKKSIYGRYMYMWKDYRPCMQVLTINVEQ